MSEQAVTAEPVSQDTGGQTAPETTTSAPEATTSSAPEPQLSFDQILSKRYDEMQTQASFAEREAEPDQPAPEASEPAQSSPAIAAPQSWSAGYQSEWSKLPPSVQQYIAQRESEAHQAISRQGQELKAYQPLRDVYAGMHQLGVPQGQEHEVIGNWLRAQAFLDRNPVEGLKWLAQTYGVNPAQLVNGQQAAPQQNGNAVDDLFKDPRVDPLQQEIQQLKAYISQLGGHVNAREQAEQSQRTDYANELIQNFSQGKADFVELQDEVAREARIIKESNPKLPMDKVLEQAYDRARWANPAHRERILSEQRAAEQAKSQEEAKKNQAAALRARAMNVRTGASASTATFDGRWDDKDKLGALYDRIQSR